MLKVKNILSSIEIFNILSGAVYEMARFHMLFLSIIIKVKMSKSELFKENNQAV